MCHDSRFCGHFPQLPTKSRPDLSSEDNDLAKSEGVARRGFSSRGIAGMLRTMSWVPVSLLYPRGRQLSPRGRVFIDWLVRAREAPGRATLPVFAPSALAL
jgi:DNA-binding transcriptional LysR family regulator